MKKRISDSERLTALFRLDELAITYHSGRGRIDLLRNRRELDAAIRAERNRARRDGRKEKK